jgi:hypothetical protein
MAVATSDERAQESRLEDARPWPSHLLLLPVALLATLALQLTTVSYFFYFDDYLPFSEIVTSGRWEYTWRLLTSTDVTPNWRPLPGMLYLGSYEVAGMNPLPVHATMLALHLGTVAMLYYAVWRTSGRAWAACLAGLVFGLNPAYVGALSQVTTATQVMADFFLVATLVAAVECAMADRASRANGWLAAAVVLWVLAIGSHEGMSLLFPVFALAVYSFDARRDGRARRALIRSAPFAAIAFATAGAFWACGCNEGARVWGTDYAWNQTLIYMGRMLYPVGLELPTEVSTSHAVAAVVLAALMLVALAGPKIGRIGALWTLLAIAPHVFIVYFTASRYLYLPAPGFAMLVAALAIMLVDRLDAIDIRVTAAVGAVLAAGLCGWYAYQTVEQNQYFADTTGDWRRFHRDVTRVFPTVPEGERVLIIGGPFQKYEYQIHILPAFAETTWGPGRTLQDYEPGSLPAQLALVSRSPYVAEYRDGALVQLYPDGDDSH